MFIPRVLLILLLIILNASACAKNKADKEQPVVLKQVPEIQEIKPQKTVKIKLRHNANGGYSWDLSGDDADEIIKTNKKLKEAFKNEAVAPADTKKRKSAGSDSQEDSE